MTLPARASRLAPTVAPVRTAAVAVRTAAVAVRAAAVAVRAAVAVLAAIAVLLGAGTSLAPAAAAATGPFAAQPTPDAYSSFSIRHAGAPLAGASLRIHTDPPRDDAALGRSSADGIVSLAGRADLTAPTPLLISLGATIDGRWRVHWWDGTRFSTNRAAARPLTLVATGGAQLTTTVAAASGGIAGRVGTSGGGGATGFDIQVSAAGTNDWVTSLSLPAAGGAYSIRGLDDGDYRVQVFAFNDWSEQFPDGYAPKWFRDADEREASQIVTVTGGAVTGGIDQVLPYGTGNVHRLAGADRFETSALLSEGEFAPDVPVAYVTTGFNFPDALAAAPVAFRRGGPILLVTPDAIPPRIGAELTRLRPQRIVVLGGTPSVSSRVETALDAYTAGPVERVSGADRFETSALLARGEFATGADVAYVANGTNFPDALVAGAIAARANAPILLVTQSSVPDAVARELAALRPGRIVVLGGTPSVSAAVAARLGDYTAGSVTRVAGTDRFHTSALLADSAYGASAPAAVPVAYITNGLNFPDALSAAVVAARQGGPVLLVAPHQLPWQVADELDRLDAERIVVLGGADQVSEDVAWQLRTYVRQ